MDTLETWPRCAAASAFFEDSLASFADGCPALKALIARFYREAGVNFVNLIDHVAMPFSVELCEALEACGIVPTQAGPDRFYAHPYARLPRVLMLPAYARPRLAIAVEDVALFVQTHELTASIWEGDADSSYEEISCSLPDWGELTVIARRGTQGVQPGKLTDSEAADLALIRDSFRERPRDGDELGVIEEAARLAAQAFERIGRDRATDEFFAAEREFYLTRNEAARWQYARQQALGIGWANHDHHTYRSARTSFRALMQLWHLFGFVPRERFYAGAEAGWGAQILEHPVSRVVIFSDVDMAPEELDIDFARDVLTPRSAFGTIGLWCALHGSSIGAAGMHHLECEFDFAAASEQFRAAGFAVMKPFTDLPILKQAFTDPEVWAVEPSRVHELLSKETITTEQAERFLTEGASGSHLEILQRWEGFKGFNKTGVSAIIRETDARRATR